MSGEPRPAGPGPELVVVGTASRDLAADDPRGWRLGGAVCYGALTAARLGLRTAALVGVDAEAELAAELAALRDAGVAVRLVPLGKGPVFENLEQPDGRRQICHQPSDPLPVAGIPPDWLVAPGWILAPVAGELSDAWASVPADAATVAVGWQGLLRRLVAGEPVHPVAPAANPLLARADLVGLSHDDVEADPELAQLYGFLRPGAFLAVTRGDRGGLVADGPTAAELRLRHYPAVRARASIDPTGAGDVFLAALTAARVQPRLVGGRIKQGFDLLLAAAAASLVVEAPGLAGVPDRAAVRHRMAEALAAPAAP